MSLEVRRSGIEGRGVFAERRIKEGTCVVEYTGKRISHEEADAQSQDDDPARKHHTFLFAVDDEVCIDASRGGNEARFINHSCDPNCDVIISRGRVYIHALRDIAEGDELSYDYWYETDESYDWDDLRRIYPCRCKAATCRGTLARPPRKSARMGGKG
jgi:uncharacterized protein